MMALMGANDPHPLQSARPTFYAVWILLILRIIYREIADQRWRKEKKNRLSQQHLPQGQWSQRILFGGAVKNCVIASSVDCSPFML